MATEFQFDEKGLKELEKAIKRNPEVVKKEVSAFLVRANAVLNTTLIRSPWQIGSMGGGVPVATGNLRDTHVRESTPWSISIKPTAPYAEAVHNGRPWLDYAMDSNQKALQDLEIKMLENIVADLAK